MFIGDLFSLFPSLILLKSLPFSAQTGFVELHNAISEMSSPNKPKVPFRIETFAKDCEENVELVEEIRKKLVDKEKKWSFE